MRTADVEGSRPPTTFPDHGFEDDGLPVCSRGRFIRGIGEISSFRPRLTLDASVWPFEKTARAGAFKSEDSWIGCFVHYPLCAFLGPCAHELDKINSP